MGTACSKLPQVEVQALEILGEFAKEHHTDLFQKPTGENAPEFDNPPVLLRRGATLRLKVSCSPSAVDVHGVVFTDLWDTRAPPVFCPAAGSAEEVAQGRCWTESASGGEAVLSVGLPPTMPVGEYSLQVAPRGEQRAANGSKVERALVLMNAWCDGAEESFPEDELREEYVLLDAGEMFYGVAGYEKSMGWNYAQFEPGVLAATRKMLRPLRAAERASPVSLSRAMAAICNAQDDGGVLVGNWSDDYSGGESPTHWTGSGRILAEWARNGKPVKYGQCWVFAGVLTSVMRCVGVASRPVTNFWSAHDTHMNRMVEYIYKEDGTKSEETRDSIWNFHVWTEVWMARLDLKEFVSKLVAADQAHGFGGWQAIDATPQERSDGKFQVGPTSLVAIRLGLSLPFDTDFLIGEVNADVRKYVRKDGELKLTSTDTTHVGRKILTRDPRSWWNGGSWNGGEDVVGRYKAQEGTPLERASLLRLEHTATEGSTGSLVLDDLHGGAKIPLGETAKFKLTLKRQEGITYPPELHMSLTALATGYTGRGSDVLGRVEARLRPDAAEQDGLQLAVDTSSKESASLLKGIDFPIMLVGAAISDDGAIMLVEEEAVELQVPEVVVVSVSPEPQVGTTSTATLSFTNPFRTRSLTGVEVLVEGPHLLPKDLRLPFKDIGPGGTLTFDIDIVPKKRDAPSLLVLTLVTREMEGVAGKHVIRAA